MAGGSVSSSYKHNHLPYKFVVIERSPRRFWHTVKKVLWQRRTYGIPVKSMDLLFDPILYLKPSMERRRYRLWLNAIQVLLYSQIYLAVLTFCCFALTWCKTASKMPRLTDVYEAQMKRPVKRTTESFQSFCGFHFDRRFGAVTISQLVWS